MAEQRNEFVFKVRGIETDITGPREYTYLEYLEHDGSMRRKFQT